jgi:hypothetical protein
VRLLILNFMTRIEASFEPPCHLLQCTKSYEIALVVYLFLLTEEYNIIAIGRQLEKLNSLNKDFKASDKSLIPQTIHWISYCCLN